MSLDDLANRSTGRAPRECGVRYALRVLPPATAVTLRSACANTAVQHAEISAALAELGVEVGGFAIGRHRNGQCKCATT